MVYMVFLAIESGDGLTIALVRAPFALKRGGASPAALVRFYHRLIVFPDSSLQSWTPAIIDLTSCALKHIVQYMKRLTMEQKTRVVAALVEGNSVRSTVRLTGVAKNTVLRS